MEEQEVIKSIKEMFPKGLCEKDEYEMSQKAINALEEIQQYREIGTVREFKSCKRFGSIEKILESQILLEQYQKIGTPEELKQIKEDRVSSIARLTNLFVTQMEIVKEYLTIGTIDECRSASEKQKPKKAYISGDGYKDGHLVYDTYECPNCGKQYEIDYDNYEYCPNCGQHMLIDLEGDEE